MTSSNNQKGRDQGRSPANTKVPESSGQETTHKRTNRIHPGDGWWGDQHRRGEGDQHRIYSGAVQALAGKQQPVLELAWKNPGSWAVEQPQKGEQEQAERKDIKPENSPNQGNRNKKKRDNKA